MSQPCQCTKDGECPRYHRHMGGRFRDICRGIDVDAGTAAVFREQWQREAMTNTATMHSNTVAPTALLLRTDQMPGDTVAMTAAIHSLHHSYPGRYVTAVESPYPEVFAHNPDVVPAYVMPTAMPLQMHYPAIHRSNDRSVHFMQAWCEHLGAALGIHLPLLTNRPHIYFPDSAPPIEDFWVICSGGKGDLTNKLWGQGNYQEVVDRLRGDVRFIQVGGTIDDHPLLHGAGYMVGHTNLRQLFDVVRRARGVLCGVSLLMHVAAALERPAVVVAGGREPVAWNAYPRQAYLHTVGALPCRSVQGHVGQACWRSRLVPLGDGTWYDRDPCERPQGGLPACMRMISPASVVEIVRRYNQN